MNQTESLSVSSLTRYIKSILEQDRILQNIYVRGEISNFKNHYASGHFYFTLKDEGAQIKAVMFRGNNIHLKFMPEDNMKVIVKARIGVYERDGTYQLYVDDMVPDGLGELSIRFEQLKKKLQAEGIFDEAHKKEIPKYPSRVGVVTSATGAAIQDILNIIRRRYPLTEVIICDVSVQGQYAAPEIAQGIKKFNLADAADVLIVGRGGGSIEDLWAFNEEIVARAVYESSIPIISAVGHETDFTICDFVADLRAPTPSAAAELAVPNIEEMAAGFEGYSRRLMLAFDGAIKEKSKVLVSLLSRIKELSPENKINSMLYQTDRYSVSIENSFNNYITANSNLIASYALKLDAASPLKILSKGYTATLKDEKPVDSVHKLKVDDSVSLIFADGTADCKVISKSDKVLI